MMPPLWGYNFPRVFRIQQPTRNIQIQGKTFSLLNSRAKFAAGYHETSRSCGILPQGDGSWQDAVKLAALRVRNSAMQFVINWIFQDNACILLIVKYIMAHGRIRMN